MAMTVELLERYVKSEVENLHLRIDVLSDTVERIDARLSRVERQLALVINSIEDLNVRMEKLEHRMDILEANMATKQDVAELKTLLLAFMKQFIPISI